MSEVPKPFLPKTQTMFEVDKEYIRKKSASKSALSDQKPRPRPRLGVKELIGAAALTITGGALYKTSWPEGSRSPEMMPRRVDKPSTEVGVDGLPWLTINPEEEKQRMTDPGSEGVEARARSRRIHTWEMYLKPLDREEVDRAVEHTNNENTDRVTYRRDRIERIRTTITEKVGPDFEGRVTERIAEAARGVVLGPDLPKTAEEASLLIDATIERTLRFAYMEAQREGWKGTNLMRADTLAMKVFSSTVRNFVREHPVFLHRNYGPLFQELRRRAIHKGEIESQIPDLRRANTDPETGTVMPRALPETEVLEDGILEDYFELLGQRGEAAQLEYLRTYSCDIRILVRTRLTWFEDHERQIRYTPGLREMAIREFSYVLDRSIDFTDPHKRSRLYHLRSRLMYHD